MPSALAGWLLREGVARPRTGLGESASREGLPSQLLRYGRCD